MRIVFIGTGEIGVPTLRALLRSPAHELVGVVTQPDKPVGRDQRMQAPPIKAELAASSVPIFQPAQLRDGEAVAQVRTLAPEVIVVMAYGQILPRSVLEIPRIGCLNLHASLLPQYRGAAPIQAVIAAGDVETGITVIYMDEGLDTGDILLQTKLAISPNETGGSLHDRLAQVAPETLLAALAQLATGQAPRQPQDSARATYAPKLSRAHGKIDWAEPAEVIERRIRAFDPWPGAFTPLADASGNSRHLKIFRASVVDQSIGDPGFVSTPNNSAVLVATGRGALRLNEVQLEGKRRMRAVEFLRGFSSPILHF
jgi:methionyl-tRNA formyltransferase